MSDKIDLAALSGLDQLRLMLDGRMPPAPIAETVGFRLTELTEGLSLIHI